MVFNDKNYPTLLQFFEDIGGIPTRRTEMSFGYYDERDHFGYALNWSPDNAFARQYNVAASFDRELGRLVKDILKFQSRVAADLDSEEGLGETTLGDYLERARAPQALRERYLVPMSAAIWSTHPAIMRQFPAASFFRFFQNHGLLSLTSQVQWRHIEGRSRRYVEAFRRAAPAIELRQRAVRSIRRDPSGVTVTDSAGDQARFDRAVLSVHADRVADLLADAHLEEKAAFAPWSYQINHAVLHRNEAVMPPDRRAWASWNYRDSHAASSMAVTYHLNRLQNLADTCHSYFLTLGPDASVGSSIDPEKILERFTFTTPVYTPAAVASRTAIGALQGRRRTYFCGSYMGHGFHEDAIASGKAVAAALAVA